MSNGLLRVDHPRSVRTEEPLPLRLSLARGSVGLELGRPAVLGPFKARKLLVRLGEAGPRLDFTLGIAATLHKRGQLEAIELTCELEDIRRFVRPILTPLLAEDSRVSVWWTSLGLGIGLAGRRSALAFDLDWVPEGDDVRVLIGRARGVGLPAPPLQLALQSLPLLFPGSQLRGRAAVIDRPAAQVVRHLFPVWGARAPSTQGIRLAGCRKVGESQLFRFSADSAVPVPAAVACPLSFAELSLPGDEALFRGDTDAARAEYIQALSQAPRHPELAGLVADIDFLAEGRAEAAIGLLRECGSLTRAGMSGGELLARAGEYELAKETLEQAARAETFGALSGAAWLRLAELAPSLEERMDALSRAVALAPGFEAARWARLDVRLETGDRRGALADAEHLEAGASGAKELFRVCARVGERLLQAELFAEAGRYFERALRYAPSDPATTLGLARALLKVNNYGRASVLLERALKLSQLDDELTAAALLDYAAALAGPLGDVPQAISKVRMIADATTHAPHARYLEGCFRLSLRDDSGATAAFSRLRLSVEGRSIAESERESVAGWLVEAAQHALRLGEQAVARTHVLAAHRLDSGSPPVAALYGELFEDPVKPDAKERSGVPTQTGTFQSQLALPQAEVIALDGASDAITPTPLSETRVATAGGDGEEPDPDKDAVLAEELETQLRAHPDDDGLAHRLADVLGRLDRPMELFALISARLEEAPDIQRGAWKNRLKLVAGELGQQARAAGHPDEAELYEGFM